MLYKTLLNSKSLVPHLEDAPQQKMTKSMKINTPPFQFQPLTMAFRTPAPTSPPPPPQQQRGKALSNPKLPYSY
jgi:hypothetical protein